LFWVYAAIASAAIAAVVAIIDSHLLSKKMPSLWSYLLPVGIIQLIMGLVIFWIFPFPANTPNNTLLIALGGGLSSSFAIILMLNTMRRDEVSRVIPVVNTSPIFVALMAVPLLDELLGFREWLAIILAVTGAMLISLRWNAGGKGIRLSRSLFPLLSSSLLFAAANIAIKYALEDISYWNMFSISTVCFGVVFISFSLRSAILRELRNMQQLRQSMTLLVCNEIAAAGAGILSYLAIRDGPVSLVATVVNTRPAFVFLFALLLSRFFPAVLNERLTKSTALLKFIAIALIVGGVALLTL
jgi:drug/metabolite transporter (DMT)-like permease